MESEIVTVKNTTIAVLSALRQNSSCSHAPA